MRNAPPPNKKRKIKTVHEEKIDFDLAAREEYLTGFHKRKLARRKHAEDEAAKKEKEEKLRFRREVRYPGTLFAASQLPSAPLRTTSHCTTLHWLHHSCWHMHRHTTHNHLTSTTHR